MVTKITCAAKRTKHFSELNLRKYRLRCASVDLFRRSQRLLVVLSLLVCIIAIVLSRAFVWCAACNMGRRGKGKFSLREKNFIVDEAYGSEANVKPTARKYGINSVQIRRWKKVLDKLSPEELRKHGNKSIYRAPSPAVLKDADLYPHLVQFFENERSADRPVNSTTLLYEAIRFKPDLALSFGALRQRMYRFLIRENLVTRRRTHEAQRTRSSGEVERDFVEQVNGHIAMARLPPQAVVNIDETNADFDQPSKTTLSRRGERTIRIASTGSSSRCTVLLGVALDGSKLPPFIVFKGKRSGRIIREVTQRASENGYPADCVYSVQDKAWIDEELMLEWIRRVWAPWVQSKNLQQSYLIMDSFKAHLVGSVADALGDVGTTAEFIVGGYTSSLQVLDIGINKPFKGYMQQNFDEFMRMRSSRSSKPTRVDVAKWISSAWRSITVQTILNTWRHIGISSSFE